MRGAIPPLPNTPSRRGALSKNSTGATLTNEVLLLCHHPIFKQNT
jgi:hypothetical protein